MHNYEEKWLFTLLLLTPRFIYFNVSMQILFVFVCWSNFPEIIYKDEFHIETHEVLVSRVKLTSQYRDEGLFTYNLEQPKAKHLYSAAQTKQ